MPIPNFKDTLQVNLAPGISIISGGDYFDAKENTKGINIDTMNKELAGGDEIVFIASEPQKEDLSFQLFLESQKSAK